jgi:ribulose kinase
MNATCKWNYDAVEGRFPVELYHDLGIADLVEKLPADVRGVGDVAGDLLPEVALELGIASQPVVAVGGIDAHVSLLACGEQDTGLVSLVGGTSTVLITETTNPVYSPAVWGPYPAALHSDRWLIEGGQVSSGSVINWLTKGILDTPRERLGELTVQAEAVAPDSHGLLVLDYFMGSRTPRRDPRLRGAVLGLTLGTTPPELYRATVEAVCYGTRSVLDSWIDAGIPVERVVISGGIRHNALWLQTTADVLARPLELVESDNLTLRSGAIQAALAAGRFPDFTSAAQVFAAETRGVDVDPRHASAYEAGYLRYLDASCHLTEDLHALADLAQGQP